MIVYPDLLFALFALVTLCFVRRWREYGRFFGIWFLFTQGVARPAVIPSESMQPALRTGDRVVVDVLGPKLHGVQRGDILAFRSPEGPKVLCKRVIGLPGETIAVRGGHVWIDGRPLQRDFTPEQSLDDFPPLPIPAGHLFMMGDSRNNSHDSRFFGPVDQELIVGKMRLLFWPPQRVGPPR